MPPPPAPQCHPEPSPLELQRRPLLLLLKSASVACPGGLLHNTVPLPLGRLPHPTLIGRR
uniref:Uncharacterized protein n=1 Tax=Arundo donax TaxID=35708 RepID=A0A0A9H4K6_ARUDO